MTVKETFDSWDRAWRNGARLAATLFFLGALATQAGNAAAPGAQSGFDDVAVGTSIDGQDYEAMRDRNFLGHRLGDEVTPHLADHIRTDGLRLRLAAPSPVLRSFRLADATKRYAGGVTLDPGTNMIKGWKAGVPFPALDAADPQIARKVIWNVALGQPGGDGEEWPRIATLSIETGAGITGYQFWRVRRLRYRGRLEGPPVLGDGRILERLLVLGLYPAEVKFVGTLTTRFATGAFPRTRLSMRGFGLAMDLPDDAWQADIEGTVQAGDDTGIFNAFPTWYSNYKLIGRRTVLAVAHSAGPSLSENDGRTPRFLRFAVDVAPHWTPVDDWEPRDVYIVEATAPKTHRYGRKVVYVDAETWQPYLGEVYDRKGDRWRTLIQGFGARPMGGGDSASLPVWGLTYDAKAGRASAWMVPDSNGPNTNVTERDVEEAALKPATE